MKKLISYLIAILGIVINSCNTNNPLSINFSNYLPLNLENYWIYERIELDSNYNQIGSIHYDSLFVSGIKILDGRKTFEINMKRDSFQTLTGNIINENNIDLYSKGFNPFLAIDSNSKLNNPEFKYDSTFNWTKQNLKWLSILNTNSVWNAKDSVFNFNEALPALDPYDGTTYFSYLGRVVNINAIQGVDSLFRINLNLHKTKNIFFSGNRLYNLICESPNIKFNKIEGYKYLYKNKTLIVNEFQLKMSFAENIGISEMTEILTDGPITKIRKYRLVRYKVN